MLKSKSRKIKGDLNNRQVFWNQVVRDIEEKLSEAKKRVSELETARHIFKRNAAIGAPIPGQGSASAATAATRN
ncbi:MAG: hypothetical protein WA188_16955 [Terriglobales bacterium]